MPGADVDPDARLGPGASVWHLAEIREGAQVGADCVIGRGAYIGAGVRLAETECAAREVLSLPVHPALSADDLAAIVTAVNTVAAAGS